jgi:DNA-binding winged helix-turn-helix (wHTH) protein/TolB-like protein/Tfp pilus assembly protein PilF
MSLDLKSNDHQNNLTTANPSGQTNYEFQDFRLDVEHLMLYRNGDEVSLTPKQVETLLALVERSGEIVSKDDLMSRLWGDTVVEESNLVQNIYVLRRTLGNTTDIKPMIETLRRRGYRFNGRLKETALNRHSGNGFSEMISPRAIPSTVDDPEISADGLITTNRNRNIIIAISALLVVFATLIAVSFFIFRKPNASSGNTSFAVLPVKPIDGDTRDNLYEVGIADALINKLSSVRGLEVRSLSEVRDYNGILQDPLAAGHEQEVDFVLAPTYQLADGRIRITAPLINVATGKVEETYTFEKEATSHFAVQDAIANDVGAKLIGRFAGMEGGPLAKRGTNSEEAYQLYLQAEYLSDKKRTPEATSKAIEHLERALQLDPNYALAWAAKAWAHRYAAYSADDPSEQYRRSIEAINKALALDPELPEAYAALCDNKFTYEYDFAGADAACKRAIELGPNSSTAHATYSHFLNTRGRFEEGLAQNQIANDLAPSSFFAKRNYANGLYLARRYDDAIAKYKQLIELDPTSNGTYNWLIRALEAQKRYEEALDWLIRSLTLQGADNDTIDRVRDAYRTSGWRGALLERIKFDTRRGDWRLAMSYAQVGKKDKAFEYLEKMYRQRNYYFHLLLVEPQLDPIRDDPRYADLVRKMEGH